MHPPFGETPSVKGAEILLTAYDLVVGDRQNDYDHPYDDYLKVRDIYEALTGVSLTVSQAVLFPLAMKLARIRTHMSKGSWHEDSVVDAVGYIACLSAVHHREP